jgi:predicted DNA-binding transcriptional regulator AlpA
MATQSDAGRAAGRFFGADLNDRLLNEHEAAERLGLKVATLRRWRWSGDGPGFIKLGGARGSAVRYAPADLAAFVAAGVRASTSDTAGRKAA